MEFAWARPHRHLKEKKRPLVLRLEELKSLNGRNTTGPTNRYKNPGKKHPSVHVIVYTACKDLAHAIKSSSYIAAE